jgi:ABC-type nitrate/sulfonate/bicarbonate transport system permease component
MSPKIISPLVLVALWETAVRLDWLDPRLVAPPSLVLVELWRITVSGELPVALGVSLLRVAAGFLLAAIGGVALGALMARVRVVEIVFDPLVELFRPVSPLALFPLFILWFGIGELSKVLIIAFACSFPIILNTYAGVRGIDAAYFRASRSLGATPMEIMRTIVLPGAMPQIFTGLRIGLGIALIVIIAAEMIGAARGIGYMVLDSEQTFRIARLFGSIVVIGILGFVIDAAFRSLRRCLLPWYQDAKD